MKMLNIFRFPQSGTSTCHAFSAKFYGRTYICSRCLQSRTILRNQSDFSVFRPAVNQKVEKPKRTSNINKRLKETELLKVTKTQTTQTRMTVGKLNASHVAAFVEEPGMILKNVKNTKSIRENRKPDFFATGALKFEKKVCDGVHGNLKNIKNSKSPLRNIPDMVKTSMNKDIMTWMENDLHERTSPGEYEESFTKESSPDYLHEESEISADTFNVYTEKCLEVSPSIYPYIDVCVHCGLLDHAFKLLTSGSVKNVKNPAVYHTLLQSFSLMGDWYRAELLVKKMEDINVPFTPQTFAFYLLSVAQGEMCDALERTAVILGKLKNKGFHINDLFSKTRLKTEERENVLKQIRKIVPHFDIAPSAMNLISNCPLVSNLYKGQQPLKSPAPFISRNFISDAVEKQLKLEEEQICSIKKIGVDNNYSLQHRKIWSQLTESWGNNFRKNFEYTLRVLKAEFENSKNKSCLYPYFMTLPIDAFVKLAVEEIDELVQFSQSYSETTYVLYKRIGHKVYQKYCRKKKTADEEYNERMRRQIEIYCRWYANPNGPARNARQKWQMLMGDNPDMAFVPGDYVPWSNSVEHMVGKFLYNVIFKSATIPGWLAKSKLEIPAFYLVLRHKNGKVTEEVKFHPIIANIVRKANRSTINFPVYELPMLCPPKPWSSPESGGYYFLSTDFLRCNGNNITRNYVKGVPNQNLYAVFDSLNKLQSVPWKINEKVLDVAIEVFNEGGSEELDVPVKPDATPWEKIPKDLDPKSKLELFKERRHITQQRQAQYGLWCEGLYKLSLANHYRNKIFWLPQNLDFRGRVYPVPPHVSHVSGDLYRSLLVFAKKEPLGKKGFDWLKIHVINLTGAHKKKSVRERLAYANEILPDILDSAENPLKGKRWWVQSDDPWQTLAACFEIREVLKSDNPETFESGFPVHQDGSCNGLQHYAALGRDMFGAVSVNLSPSDTPQDVYSDVANLIELERAKDDAEGLEIAKLLKGFVNRKVVKRPVMTTVYGVTWYGAKLQIAGVLSDMPEFPRELISSASSYLATKIFFSLRKLFTSAKEIQDWFNACSEVITRDCNSSVSWENPLGLPVIQPYFKKNKRDNSMRPDSNKQKNAFAPNFIHSLDSAHMMLTALHCEPAGITFASVHDCFWTHPSSVDVMNKLCRECFVELHSLEILETLSKHFIKNYANDENSEKCQVFTRIPKLGDFDLNTVKNSVYFFA